MDLKSKLDGLYEFMNHAHQGNWQNRWGSTPFMTKFASEGKRESILGHMWGCMELWYQIKKLCPELNKAVNSSLLYEILLNHDLGETYSGDISMTRQINGEGSGKKLTEREQIQYIVSTLDSQTQKGLLKNFDNFEKDLNKVKGIEVLTAKFIDTLHGDHFMITFGNDLSKNSELINKIINIRFMVQTKRLIEVLNKSDYKKAAIEIKQVANHHLEQIRLSGIKVTAQDFEV